MAHGWGFVWPANRRILYNRASADPSGKPWSEKKKLIWWDAEPGRSGWATTCRTSPAPWRPTRRGNKDGPFKGISGTDAFIMNPHGLGQFFASVLDGAFPEHYEPFESPTTEPPVKRPEQPGRQASGTSATRTSSGRPTSTRSC